MGDGLIPEKIESRRLFSAYSEDDIDDHAPTLAGFSVERAIEEHVQKESHALWARKPEKEFEPIPELPEPKKPTLAFLHNFVKGIMP